MTLRTLWQLCDVSFNLEMKPSTHNQKHYLAELSALLAPEDNLSGNGVDPELLDVFENLARLVDTSKGLSRSLVHGFYYVGIEVRFKLKHYCKAHKINTVNLDARAPRTTGRGPRGDADFKHSSLPYKDK